MFCSAWRIIFFSRDEFHKVGHGPGDQPSCSQRLRWMPSEGWCWLREALRLLAHRAGGPATPVSKGQGIGLAPPRVSERSPAPALAPGILTPQLLVSACSGNTGPGSHSSQPHGPLQAKPHHIRPLRGKPAQLPLANYT